MLTSYTFSCGKKLNRLNGNELRHCQALLNAFIEGYKRRFSKFLQFDPPAPSECKAAVLAAVSNPQFELRWLTIKYAYNTTAAKKDDA